jgi:hypothetical protein
LASSLSVTVNGSINANGGDGSSCNCYAAGGSGGAIRIAAPSISILPGSQVSALGGISRGSELRGSFGLIRLESFSLNLQGNLLGTPILTSTPYALNSPLTPPGAIRVTSVNGTPITENPFTFPDTTINSSAPVSVVIKAQYIPPGTIPTIYIFSETGGQSVQAPALTGTLQNSTSTLNITFPTGGSRGFVKAIW